MLAPRLALLTVAGALAAAGVTGCAQQSSSDGDKDFQGDAARVANTIRALDDAYTDEVNDDTGSDKVCRTLLSQKYVQELGGRDCAKNVAVALKNADSTEMDVRDVKILPGGDVANAQVRIKVNDDEQRLDTLTLIKESATWKFDGSAKGAKAQDGKPAVAPAAPAPSVGSTGTTGASGATSTTGAGATTTPTPAAGE